MAASSDHEESYCIQEELELLEAIFIHELTIERSSKRPSALSITLHPSTGDEEDKKYVCLTLYIELPIEYPSALPSIVIRSPRGLSEAHVNSILDNLQEHARERIGGPMLYELIQYAKDSLTDNNTPSCECAICLCHFQDSHCFTRTECYHYFHCSCLARFIEFWLKQKEDKQEVECPVCRLPITYDLDVVNAAPAADTEQVEMNYKPSDEIKKLQAKMAAVYENQKRKGGIIDIEWERNKFLIDITSTPQQSAELESSDSSLVSEPHSDELVSPYTNSSKAKESETSGIRGKHSKGSEYWRRKQQRPHTSRTGPRDSPTLGKKEPTERPVQGRNDFKLEKQSLDCTLEVKGSKKEKDKAVDTYSKKKDDVKTSKEIGKGKATLDNAKSESPKKCESGKGNVANLKAASVNDIKESDASLIECEKKEENANVAAFLVEDKDTIGISRKDLEKPKNVGEEIKDRGLKSKKELLKENSQFATSGSTDGSEINECPGSKTLSKVECTLTETERKQDSRSSSAKKREIRQRTANKKDVNKKGRFDEKGKPKTETIAESGREIVIDGGSEITLAREQAGKGKKFNEKHKPDSKPSAIERRKNNKPLQVQTEDSKKGLSVRDRVHCNNNNGKDISENYSNEPIKEEWPGLNPHVQEQQTREKQHSQKKRTKKNKDSWDSEETKPHPLPGSGARAGNPGWSDVAKLGLSSAAKDNDQSVRDKHFEKRHHRRVRDDKQKREVVCPEMKGSTLTPSKSEKQEPKKVGVARGRSPAGFEGERLKSGEVKPPPGFEDKISKPVGMIPPPGFESIRPRTGTSDKAKTRHEPNSGFGTLNK